MGDSRLGKPSKKQRMDKPKGQRVPATVEELKAACEVYFEYDKPFKETVSKSGVPRAKAESLAEAIPMEHLEQHLAGQGLEPLLDFTPGLPAVFHVVKNEIKSGTSRRIRPMLVPCVLEKRSATGNRAHVVLQPNEKALKKVVMLDSLFIKKAA